MCSNTDRKNYARRIIIGKGSDVDQQRNERRQRLIHKFKSLRIQAFDSLRNLKDDTLTYQVLCEIKKDILATLDNDVLLEEENLTEFFNDLDKEISLLQCEEYEKLCDEELNVITNNLMNKCDFCGKLIIQNEVCETCTQKHFQSPF